MTTTVIVSVPAGADYKAEIKVYEGCNPVEIMHTAVYPGLNESVYVYGSRYAVVAEVPLKT